MNKTLILLLLASCSAYGMEISNHNDRTLDFIDLFANNVKALHPNELSKMELVTTLKEIVPDNISFLCQGRLSERREKFTAGVILALKQRVPGTTLTGNLTAYDRTMNQLRFI
jgi:hypothetical protein